MPALKCTAVKCIYNKEQLCSKGDIQVTGDHATAIDETACGSFREQTGSKNSAACGCGQTEIKVACAAETCMYNKNRDCHAGAIDINGARACCSSETCCGTFRKEA